MSAEVVELSRALPRRAAYVVTAEEMEALFGVGPLAFMVYMWLRSWMDFRTGVVGFTRALSREMLCTYCETHTPRGQGVQMSKPTLKQLRGALDALIRQGLLIRRDTELLVFRMPMARVDNVRPLQTGPSEGRVQGRDFSSSDAGLRGEQGRGFSANRADNGLSESAACQLNAAAAGIPARDPSSEPLSAAAASESVDNSVEREMSQADARAALLMALLDKHHVRVRSDQAGVVESWVKRGVTDRVLLNAIGKAKTIRQRESSDAPLNLGLINVVLADFKPPKKTEKQPAESDWRANSAGIYAKARQLGMAHSVVQAPDGQRLETLREFVIRIEARLREQGESHG